MDFEGGVCNELMGVRFEGCSLALTPSLAPSLNHSLTRSLLIERRETWAWNSLLCCRSCHVPWAAISQGWPTTTFSSAPAATNLSTWPTWTFRCMRIWQPWRASRELKFWCSLSLDWSLFMTPPGQTCMPMLCRDAETVPMVSDTLVIPCEDPDTFADRPILFRMSCAARRESVLVLVNMIDSQPCDRSADPNCPDDDRYQVMWRCSTCV